MKTSVISRCERAAVAGAIQTVLIALVLFLSIKSVSSDGVFSYPAFWPGPHVTEFLASSGYSSCRDVALPSDSRSIEQMAFDPDDNLWFAGVNIHGLAAGVTEALASHDYKQFKGFMPNERPGGI